MADPLSIGAGVVGLLTFAGSTLTKGYSILASLQGSKTEIQRLLAELSQLTGVLVAIEAQENAVTAGGVAPSDKDFSRVIESTIVECRQVLKKAAGVLEKLDKSRRAVAAVKWVLVEPEVRRLIEDIARYRTVFVLCLGVDSRKATQQILEQQFKISAQISSLKQEQEMMKGIAQDERAEHRRQALFRWLVPLSEKKHSAASNKRVERTGQWLLNHPQYLSWWTGVNPVLWLHGIAGCGKTHLVSRIVDSLKEQPSILNKSAGLLYFYCSFQDNETFGALEILRSLVAQLIRSLHCPEKGAAMHLFEGCDDGTLTPTLDQVQGLLVTLASELEIVYICLDALDECKQEDKNDLLYAISVLTSSCTNVRILASSRSSDSEVEAYLGDHSQILLTSSSLERDIEAYIRYRVAHGQERLRRALSAGVIRQLISDAGGMFLWVSCQIDQLARLRTTASVQNALLSLPIGLDNTYDRILLNISSEDRPFAVRALRLLAHSIVPLRLEEVAEAIVVEDYNSSLESLQRFLVPQDIFEICGSLICHSEVSGELSLAHHSVYEYLTKADNRPQALRKYHIPARQSAIRLTVVCLKFLSFPEFGLSSMEAAINADLKVTIASKTQRTESLLKHPFLSYALKNWWQHLPNTLEDLDQVWPMLEAFFNRETGNFASCVLALSHLEGAYKYPKGMRPFHFCSSHGLLQTLSRISGRDGSDGLDQDTEVEDGRKALHMAAENGHEEIVRVLLSLGVDANATTSDGRTPLQCAIECGNEAIAKLLVSRGGADVNRYFSHGETPLSVAVNNKWNSVIKFLLREGAHVNEVLADDLTVLHVAAETGSDIDVFDMLFKAGADRYATDKSSWTPLHYAAYYGHAEAALMLISDKSIQSVFNNGSTPLHIAVEQEHIEVVRLFGDFAHTVSKLAFQDRNRTERYGGPAQLSIRPTTKPPISEGRTNVSRTKSKRPRIDEAVGASQMKYRPSVEEDNPSPLSRATSQEFIAGIDFLVKAGTDEKDLIYCIEYALEKRAWNTLLHLVCHSDRLIRDLFAQIYNKLPDKESRAALKELCLLPPWNVEHLLSVSDVVIGEDDQELLKLIIKRLRELDESSEETNPKLLTGLLQIAVRRNNLNIVKLLQDAGAFLFDVFEAELGRQAESRRVTCTLLHLAVDLQVPEIVLYLLENPMVQITKDSFGMTPLHYAVQSSKPNDIVSFLLSSGADALAVDDKARTPLHIAAKFGSVHSIVPLLDAGAALNQPDLENRTPLHYCAHSFRVVNGWPSPAMQLLIDCGASLQVRDKLGSDPILFALLTAIQDSYPGVLTSILEEYPELIKSRIPPSNHTPLHWAALANCGEQILKILLAAGAVLDDVDGDGRTPLQIAGPVATEVLLSWGATTI